MADRTASAVASAVVDLAAVWAESGPYENADLFSGMTCDEVEALTNVFRTAGHGGLADAITEAHARGDWDAEDAHHDIYTGLRESRSI